MLQVTLYQMFMEVAFYFRFKKALVCLFLVLLAVITPGKIRGTEIKTTESQRTARRNILNDEKITSDNLDTGLYKGLIVQDLNNIQNSKGFVYLPILKGFFLHTREKTPDAMKRLVKGIQSYTFLKATIDLPVAFDSPNIAKYPFLYITPGIFRLTESEKRNLKTYLKKGGFIALEVHRSQSTQLLHDYFGDEFIFKPVPEDHPLYHCFFNFKTESSPQKSPALITHGYNGIWQGNKLVGVYGSISSGMWDVEHKNEQELKMGINVVVYALIRYGNIAQKR